MNLRPVLLSLLLFFTGGVLLLAATLALFLGGGTTPFQEAPEDVPELSDPFRPPGYMDNQCGFSTCNGYENLDCSTNTPTRCTEIYKVGDRCRQFATCTTENGSCQLQTSPAFNSCVSCVESCKQQFADTENPSRLFTCEQECTNAL